MLILSSQGHSPTDAARLPNSVGAKTSSYRGNALTSGGECLVPCLSGFGWWHGGLRLLLPDCSPHCYTHTHQLQRVTRTHSGPSADTHHIPLLHTVAALDEGGPSGYTAACRGDVTLRPSKDGVGPWLTPFLPIPTILQGNSVRVSTCRLILTQPFPLPHPAPSGRVISCFFAHDDSQRTKHKNKHFLCYHWALH